MSKRVAEKFLKRACFWAIFLSFGFSSAVCLAQTGDAAGHARKFEKKWNEYIQALRNVEGSFECLYTRNGERDAAFTKYLVGAYPLWAEHNGSLETALSASVAGENYRFALSRAKPEDDWRVDDISTDFSDRQTSARPFPEHFADPPHHNVDFVGYAIFNGLGVGLFGVDSNPNLPYMFSGDWIRIESATPIKKDGADALRVTFEYDAPKFPKWLTERAEFSERSEPKKYSLKGDVVLSTDYFLVTEGTFRVEWLDSVRDVQVEIEYDVETAKIPLPKRYYNKEVRISGDGEKEESVFETECKFDLKPTSPKSPKRFTLSQYGLPEPEFETPRADRIRPIFITLGVALILAVGWRIYRRRRNDG